MTIVSAETVATSAAMEKGEFGKRQFFLQSVDPLSGFVLEELACGESDIGKVSKASGITEDNFSASNFLILEDKELRSINSFFGVDFDPRGNDACLYSWSEADGLPYRVHAGREFLLLMSGKKPLATFSGIVPENEAMVEIPEYLIDRLIDNGNFVKVEYCEPNPVKNNHFKGLRYVLVSHKNESWRIDAYILLQRTAEIIGWSEPLTRLQGSLLGYSDQENDAYAASVRNRNLEQMTSPTN